MSSSRAVCLIVLGFIAEEWIEHEFRVWWGRRRLANVEAQVEVWRNGK